MRKTLLVSLALAMVSAMFLYTANVNAGPKPPTEKATGGVGYEAYGLQRWAEFAAFEGTNRSDWHWDLTGTWVATFEYQGAYYAHDMVLTQTGNMISGSGGYPVGGPYQYAWTITSGTISGSTVNLTAIYTVGAIGTTMHMTGTIDANGQLVLGTWDDNFGGLRIGTWTSTSGAATKIGNFHYSDAAGNWYYVDVSDTRVEGDYAWFAGPVISASNPSWIGNWVFAKVYDGGEPAAGVDQIWGIFTDMTSAKNGVATMVTPGIAFTVTSGNLQVHTY